MAGIFDSLNNLPVFEGRSDEARRRALLETGLALMQPQDPLKGGGIGTQFTGGIQAGLQSLDKTDALKRAAEQQAFQNTITGREATVKERQAGAAETNAGANVTQAGAAVTNAETNRQGLQVDRKKLAEQARQFDQEAGLRASQEALNYAKARLQDRLPESSGSTTSADIDLLKFKAKLGELWQRDKMRSPAERLFSGPDDPALHNAAWGEITVREGLAGGENLPIIANSTEDATQLGQRAQAIADTGLAGLQEIAAQKASPLELKQADLVMGWSAAEWRQAIEANDPTVDALVRKFPGVRRAAVAALTGSSAAPATGTDNDGPR